MADCACRSRSQMASKPPRSTLSRVGLSSSGDPGPAHKCPLIISSCRKTGWSSPRPCYQAPLHIPAQTCYVTWATTCPHLPNPCSTGLSSSLLPPGRSNRAALSIAPTAMAHEASVQRSGPRGLKPATPSPPSVYWKVQWSRQQAWVQRGGGWVSREPGHLVNEHLRAHPRLLGAETGSRRETGSPTGLRRASPAQFAEDTTRDLHHRYRVILLGCPVAS